MINITSVHSCKKTAHNPGGFLCAGFSRVGFYKFPDNGFDKLPEIVGAGSLTSRFCRACYLGFWGMPDIRITSAGIGSAYLRLLGGRV